MKVPKISAILILILVNKLAIAAVLVFGVLFTMLIITSIQQSFAGAFVLVLIVIAAIGFLIATIVYFVYWLRKTKPKA